MIFRTLYGMLFALLIIILRKLKLIEDSNHLNLCPRSVSVFALSCSIIGIGSYAIFGSFCPNPKYCNEIHPYIVFIPVSENIVNYYNFKKVIHNDIIFFVHFS